MNDRDILILEIFEQRFGDRFQIVFCIGGSRDQVTLIEETADYQGKELQCPPSESEGDLPCLCVRMLPEDCTFPRLLYAERCVCSKSYTKRSGG